MDEFVPPKVEKGDVVLWSQDGGADATPAIVTSVGHHTLSLAVVIQNYTNFLVKDGVRHAEDPCRKRGNNSQDGLWCLTPRNLRLNELLASFEPEPVGVLSK